MRLANATPERIREVTAINLDALGAILRWNVDHGIEVFRISSNTIPFGSHPVNTVRWWDEFGPELTELGRLMRGMSISTHPGQYTVLGSQRAEVVDASVAELEYQARLLSSFGLDTSHKIVIHLSGTEERFLTAAARLSPGASARLVVENDERWSLADVLPLGRPAVFDVFHHTLNHSLPELDVRGATMLAGETWTATDGRQEVHFSTQEPGKRPGAHSSTLDVRAFAEFSEAVGDLPLDCVLEVKDKERSALVAQTILRATAAA
ncbi:MAG: damage endonuclease [Gaiellaceae bacterium]|jgi:UV DNA damage endonuclease|nr:damage endonuclease [Gaiellaceae bacterium]